MAHTRQNVKKGEPVFGSSQGSRGAVYYHTTDAEGAISCTCPDFMSGKTAKGTAVADRVCKHLRLILAGDYSIYTPQAKAGSARAMGEEIMKDLESIEKKIALAKSATEVTAHLKAFTDLKAKAIAFTDKLQFEIEDVKERVNQAQRTALGKF
jgi:hypothetical protein